MSEIPEDVIKTARRLAAHCFPSGDELAADAIARAIMAERERAANIAQTHIPEGIHPDDLYRWSDTAGAIAAAIRSGK